MSEKTKKTQKKLKPIILEFLKDLIVGLILLAIDHWFFR